MPLVRFASSLLVVFALLGAASASASERVALVIGNDSYTFLPDLKNAGNDAADIAAELEKLGWEVILRRNSSQREMGHAIGTFESRLATAEAGLVFYAGHGIQARGENWLIPSDAEVESEVDLKYESVSARDILEAMKRSGVPLNIVILDACRDNPLRQSTRSASRGLAVPAMPQGIKGTAVMFSAAPGETAADGPVNGNGVFTSALLKTLSEPGLKLEEVFKQTARRVAELTDNGQRPWFNSSVFGDFYFNEGEVREPDTTSVAPASQPSGGDEVEIVFWQSIRDSDKPVLFESYLKQYPNGAFAGLARAKLAILRGNAGSSPAVSPAIANRAETAVSASRAQVERPAVETASRPPTGADRARVERILADSRDDLRRNLTEFMVRSGHTQSIGFKVQNIWKARLVDEPAEGYVIEINYEASLDMFRREYETRTLKFLMRLDGEELKFVELLSEHS